MIPIQLETERLTLALRSPAQVKAAIEAFDPVVREQVSADWLRRVTEAREADPWAHGFTLTERMSGALVGTAGFKAPPDADGVVEIAYEIAPEHQGRGYATEAAQALTIFAFDSGEVRLVRAHTLAERNASTRVLTKAGFQFMGEVIDPEDGLVWRWEKRRGET